MLFLFQGQLPAPSLALTLFLRLLELNVHNVPIGPRSFAIPDDNFHRGNYTSLVIC